MRKVLLTVLAVLLAGLVVIPASAEAGHRRHPHGWGHERAVVHYGYYPRYRHIYVTHPATDPYAYRYEPRGYYPYYNSGYWLPAHEMRKKRRHYRQPPYYQSWGTERCCYQHRKWHRIHHGYIRRHHW